MKYTCEIVIDKPRDEVIKLFDIKYDFGKRKMELIETITFRNLPDEFHGNYQTKGVVNIQKNYFKDEGQKTKWISETEFKFSGFMKLMAFF
ncbi:MAG: SRPBCC family protein, partial [Ekhidna sp.]